MYNQFIKKITADLSQYFRYETLVNTSRFNLKNSDLNEEAAAFISSNEQFDENNIPDILKEIFKDKIALLQYLAKNPSDGRLDYVLKKKPDFASVYLPDVTSKEGIDFSLYYITKVLNNDLTKDPNFIQKLKNILKTHKELIPIYIYITGDADKSLVESFTLAFSGDGNEKVRNEHMSLIKDFMIALQQHNKLDEVSKKDANLNSLLEFVIVNSTRNLDPTSSKGSNGGPKAKNSTNVFGLDLKTANKETRTMFNQLNNLSKSTILSNSFDNFQSINDLVDKFCDSVPELNYELLKNLIVSQAFSNTIALSDNDSFRNFLITLKNKITGQKKSKPTTGSLRGKKMFKLAKAYTRYYIKNMLPNMLRCAGNDPKATSNVIKVSTDEIQDLMYGDTINHPENLAEVTNPAVRDQIASDVEQAVKGDQIPGGAADGLSIEDIAKKWSEIYKQVPYEYLLDVLKTQEQAGSIVEQEHTDNLEIAKEIARDHLVEAPDYYTHLENMEEVFPAENVSERPLPEPEGMDLQTLDNPLPKDEEHICDGSCGGNCKCHHDKVQTVEDKIKGLDGDGMMVIMVEETPEVETVEEQPLEFIQQIAAKIKR